jgi:hypothetical protein
MLRLIVTGGRDFNDYELLSQKLDLLLSKTANAVIISGMGQGADNLAERYAEENKIRISTFAANKKKYGNSWVLRKHIDMARNADACVCFWDGKSAIAKHMIDTAQRYNLKLRIINY